MAAEDIARVKSRYAVVPRDYFQHGDKLTDIYDNDLKQVFVDGAEWAAEEAAKGTLGAEWEAERRWAEVRNIKKFLDLPPGNMMIEISAPPERPAAELRAQGYTGMTHVRVSAKVDHIKVKQYNIILPAAGGKFLKDLQILLGVAESQAEPDAQRLLARPLEMPIGENTDEKLKELENLCGAALLGTNPDKAVLQMIKKAAGARREAWKFVDAAQHDDLNLELAAKIDNLARQGPAIWQSGIEEIRIGYMKELRERYDGKFRLAAAGSIIEGAAAQAVADSDVFITCGTTLETARQAATATSHGEVAARLLRETAGSGTCSACGATGTLWGCGVFCATCNRIWCDEYAKSGKELSYSQIRYLRHGKLADARPRSFIDDIIDSWQEWNRRYDEEQAIKRKRLQAKRPVSG